MVQSSAMENETTITTNDQSNCQFIQKKTAVTKRQRICKLVKSEGEKYLPCNIPITVDPTKIQIIKEYFEKIYPNH